MPKESDLLTALVAQTAKSIERPTPTIEPTPQVMTQTESPEEQEARRLAYLRKPPRP